MRPQPLGPSQWRFDPDEWPADDCVAAGADLEPDTIVAAYRHGAFPMPHDGQLLWWSPMRRGVLEPTAMHVSRSLQRSMRHFTVTVDQSFEAVITACADPVRSGSWIDDAIRTAYVRLHHLGWAHSIEVSNAAGDLVGGLYGLGVGDLFAGESMFHRETDASKVAVAALAGLVGPHGLIDVQWRTPHLASLGATEWPRDRYLAKIATLIDHPAPEWVR